MKLYTFVHSPNPLKVRFALAELGIDYQAIEINLFAGEHRRPDFRALNPHGKVPVLADGDVVLAESNAILSHLGETRGGASWPSDAAGRARALRWLFFESVSLANHCGTLWWTDVAAPKAGRPGSAQAVVDDAVEELERSLGVLDEELAKRDFLLTGFSLVDCSIGVALQMLSGTRFDVSRWPHAMRYRERVVSRPSWAAARGEAIHVFG
jgi:glutathione S-transferase